MLLLLSVGPTLLLSLLLTRELHTCILQLCTLYTRDTQICILKLQMDKKVIILSTELNFSVLCHSGLSKINLARNHLFLRSTGSHTLI